MQIDKFPDARPWGNSWEQDPGGTYIPKRSGHLQQDGSAAMKRFIFVKPLERLKRALCWRARPSIGLCDRLGKTFEEVAFEWLPKPEDKGQESLAQGLARVKAPWREGVSIVGCK